MTVAISIVLPVYNAGEFLRDCLDSIQAQTFHDFELICINDGSTDNSPVIIQDYVKKIPQMRVYHQDNIGQYPTRNVAMSYVRGRYTLSIDCDDVADPHLLERAYFRAESESADITMFGWKYLDSNRESPDVACWNLRNWDSPTEKKFPLWYGYLWMKLYRTDFLMEHGLAFWEDFYCKADTIFHWTSLSLAKHIAVIPEPLYYYRLHDKSVTGTIGDRYVQVIRVMETIKNELIAIGDPKDILPAWYPFALNTIRSVYLKAAPETRGIVKLEIRNFLDRLSLDELKTIEEPGIVADDTRFFYMALRSKKDALLYGWVYSLRKSISITIRRVLFPSFVRVQLIERIRAYSFSMSRDTSTELRHSVTELNNRVNELSAENVRLRQSRL